MASWGGSKEARAGLHRRTAELAVWALLLLICVEQLLAQPDVAGGGLNGAGRAVLVVSEWAELESALTSTTSDGSAVVEVRLARDLRAPVNSTVTATLRAATLRIVGPAAIHCGIRGARGGGAGRGGARPTERARGGVTLLQFVGAGIYELRSLTFVGCSAAVSFTLVHVGDGAPTPHPLRPPPRQSRSHAQLPPPPNPHLFPTKQPHNLDYTASACAQHSTCTQDTHCPPPAA